MKAKFILFISFFLSLGIMVANTKKEKEKNPIVITKNEKTGRYGFEKVIVIEGLSADEIFKRAKQYVISTFKTVDNNIQFDEENKYITNNTSILIDKANGKVGIFSWAVVNGICNFKFNLQIKDGRYKIIIDDLIIKYTYSPDFPPNILTYDQLSKKRWDEHILNDLNGKIAGISESLEAAIKNEGKNVNDDW